jgi:hypothetical protein
MGVAYFVGRVRWARSECGSSKWERQGRRARRCGRCDGFDGMEDFDACVQFGVMGAWCGAVMGSDACGLCLRSSEMHRHFPWAVRTFAASRNRIVVCEDRTRSLIFDRWSQKVRRTVSNRPCDRFDSGAISSLVTVGLRSLSLYVVILAWRAIGRSRKHCHTQVLSCDSQGI